MSVFRAIDDYIVSHYTAPGTSRNNFRTNLNFLYETALRCVFAMLERNFVKQPIQLRLNGIRNLAATIQAVTARTVAIEKIANEAFYYKCLMFWWDFFSTVHTNGPISAETVANGSTICYICFEDAVDNACTLGWCMHAFHINCIATWCASRTTERQLSSCPLCRILLY